MSDFSASNNSGQARVRQSFGRRLGILLLSFFIAASTALSVQAQQQPPLHFRYRMITDPHARNFVMEELDEAVRQFGQPAIPVNHVIVCLSEPADPHSHLERHFQRTDLEDAKHGVMVIYVSVLPKERTFYGQLGHEAMHLLNPCLYDPYVEGINTVFAEEFMTKKGMDWTFWRKYFEYGNEPFYGETYFMMKEIEGETTPEQYHMILRFAVPSFGSKWVEHIAINSWLKNLPVETRQKVIDTIKKHAAKISETMPSGGQYAFMLPAEGKVSKQ